MSQKIQDRDVFDKHIGNTTLEKINRLKTMNGRILFFVYNRGKIVLISDPMECNSQFVH